MPRSRLLAPALAAPLWGLCALLSGAAHAQQVKLPPPTTEEETGPRPAPTSANKPDAGPAFANNPDAATAIPKDAAAAGALRASERTAFGASGSPPTAADTGSGLSFGSYGRAGIGSDLRGNGGYGVNVVSFGSRLEKPSYLELNFYYGGTIGDDPAQRWRAVVVPAFAGELFHYSGNFTTQNFGLRNAYAETENLFTKGLRLWAGSRMYRGDDVYLFDFWPLDNLNTVGGGVGYRFNHDRTDFAWQVGMNRLSNIFQFQEIPVPARNLPPDSVLLSPQAATGTALQLDRPRVVTSFKLTHFLRDLQKTPNAKVVLYAELHYLPAGQRQTATPGTLEQTLLQLPQDFGWVAGAQLGGWLRPFVFANVFLRAAGGLAAYGDLGQPFGFDNNLQVTKSRDITAAFSLNWESQALGVMGGGYVHSFRDASSGDNRGFDEGALAVRPQVYLSRYFHLAGELSYQLRSPVTVDQNRGAYLHPQVFRASVMPVVAPLGRGTYSRPAIYAVYTLSLLNGDAQYTLWNPGDIRAGHTDVHYLGLGAEWWFNSSYR